MVFGIGADGSGSDAGSGRPPAFTGGQVNDDGAYTPPAPRTPDQAINDNATQPLSWNTNDSPVPYMNEMELVGTADRPIGYRPTGDVINKPFYEAALFPNQLRGRSRGSGSKEYDIFVAQLRAYTKQKLGTDAAVDDAWGSLLKDAQGGNVAAMELLNSVLLPDGSIPQDSGGGTRGGGAYTGPRESITVQAESDINATANALALEMIGRPLSEKELAKVTRRIRGAEMEQPQVTTGDIRRTVTTQGLTAQGREDILRDVISKRPEFEKYQLDTTVMDAMNAYVQEKRQVVDV